MARFTPSMSCGFTNSASVSSCAAPGELAEDQDAGVGDTARHELLRDQVHPIMERRHEHHVRGAVERGRPPSARAADGCSGPPVLHMGEVAVDLADELLDAAALVAICRTRSRLGLATWTSTAFGHREPTLTRSSRNAWSRCSMPLV